MMKQFEMDWQFVLRHSMRPALCAAAAILALSVAVWLHSAEHARYVQLTTNHAVMHEDYDVLVNQKRVVRRYHRSYQRFHELGFIGRESRLDWVESMRIVSASLALPTLNYSIEPQLAVAAPMLASNGGEDIQIRVSRLQLEMGLIHELDLLRFFDELQRQAPGLIKVDQCDLERIADGGVADEANLTANCAVQIYSVITTDVSRDLT
jgi:hypothetical protein